MIKQNKNITDQTFEDFATFRNCNIIRFFKICIYPPDSQESGGGANTEDK